MKKILFVSHGFACFMSDILFHGFKSLGCDIYEYPQGTHYYGGDSVFGGIKNLGRNDFLSFCYFNFLKKDMTDEEILNQDYDCVVITSWRPDQTYILENIYKRFKGKVPIAFVDGEDDTILRNKDFYCDVYFKRELNPFLINEKIRSITFGIIDNGNGRNYNMSSRCWDTSFIASGHNENGLRCQMFRHLRSLENKNIFYCDVERNKTGMMNYDIYRAILRASKTGISIRGEGYDTFRYYEIPYFGALLIADKPTIHIENNFTDMVNSIFFNDVKDWQEKFDYLKNKPELIAQMAEKGYKHLLKFHDPDKGCLWRYTTCH
jgi:hypothetical protein